MLKIDNPSNIFHVSNILLRDLSTKLTKIDIVDLNCAIFLFFFDR